MIVVIDIEDCLAEEGVGIPGAAASRWGKRIYEQMNAGSSSVILMSTDRDRDLIKTWLLREQYTGWIELLTRDKSLKEPEDFKVESVSNLISQGKYVSLYISSDATVAARMAALGVTQLVVVPGTGKPGEKAPDIPYKTWEHLVTIIDDEKIRKAEMADRRDRHFTEES